MCGGEKAPALAGAKLAQPAPPHEPRRAIPKHWNRSGAPGNLNGMGMRRLVITALATAIVGGVLSAALRLGTVASDALLVGAIALTLPFVLGITAHDVRVRLHRR